MNEQEMLSKMKAPGDKRPTAYRQGVIQILVTSSCNLQCYNCTQGSQLKHKHWEMTPEQFEQAVLSLKGFTGVIGTFGGNPAMAKNFVEYCAILRKHVPFEQRGLWCNDLLTEEKGRAARETFCLGVSNLNVHMDQAAYDRFKKWWPESNPVGLHTDSRHAPVFGSMRDLKEFWKSCPTCKGFRKVTIDPGEYDEADDVSEVACPECNGTGKVYDEAKANALIANCDINQRWSAGIGVFRGQLRGYFCEVAMAMSILHQDNPNWPDTGLPVNENICYKLDITTEANIEWRTFRPCQWWELKMESFAEQVRQHCRNCLVPLRGHGELAMAGDEGKEQTTRFHEGVFRPKRSLRIVESVNSAEQLGQPLDRITSYLQNAAK